MAYSNIRPRSRPFQPAAVGSTEPKSLLQVVKGDRVIAAALRRMIAAAGATTSTFELRASAAAGGAAGGLIAATDTEGAVGSVVSGAGADLANSGGFLCTGDGTIDLTYTIGATPGAINPACEVGVMIVRDALFNG